MDNIDNQINKAVQAIQHRDLNLAASILKNVLDQQPSSAIANSLFGHCLINTNSDMALEYLKKATILEPSHPQWNINYGKALLQFNQPKMAIPYLKLANENLQDHATTLELIILSYMAMGQFDSAFPYTQKLANKNYSPKFQRIIARIHFGLGKYDEVIQLINDKQHLLHWTDDDKLILFEVYMQLQQYDVARKYLVSIKLKISENPLLVVNQCKLEIIQGNIEDAKLLLKALKPPITENPEVLALSLELGVLDETSNIEQKCEDISLTLNHRRRMAFALCHHFDKANNFSKAWKFCKLANNTYHQEIRFSLDIYQSSLDKAVSAFEKSNSLNSTKEFTPIYIVGAPRTGSTLIQNILSSPTNVKSIEERGALLPYLLDKNTTQLNTEHLKQLKTADISGISTIINPQINHVIDKTPHHALIIGLLQRIHPNAIFIEVTRSIQDTALSILMQDFNEHFEYARSFKDACDYLEFHNKAISEWRTRGIEIHTINYEDFVNNPAIIKALFTKLEIEFQDEFLIWNKRDSTTKNFSSIASRKKISKTSVNRYANYKEYL